MDLELIPDKRVSYYFDEEIGIYTFKKGHPMRPLRIKITDELVKSYGMDKLMTCYDSTFFEMDDKDFMNFHSEEYIDLLKNINEENLGMYQDQFTRFGFSADCPHPSNSKFYDFCKLYTSGSILGSKLLNQNKVDVAINWSGGLHHAKRQEASGFCYVNDCVLAIIEMLKVYPRVLYLDIDVHHGDGVEEAFFTTDRVLTCSFHHKYKDFFPGTGDHKDIGFERGKYHAVNFPLREGIDDLTYEHIFKPVLDGIIESFNPSAILMQCGSDSLSGDKLGCFNLSIAGHGKCVEYIKKTGIPLLLTGGGGYTLRNIPRCWTYETSLALDFPIDNKIPDNQYVDYFYPEGTLHTPISNMDNLNSNEKLHDITNQILEHLRTLERYNPDTTVEHKYGPETENKLLEEKVNINQEINEEQSEKNRTDINTNQIIQIYLQSIKMNKENTNQEIINELINNLKYITHTQSMNVSDSIQEKIRRFFYYNRFLKNNIDNLKEEYYFEIEQDITQQIENKIVESVSNHINQRKYLILEQLLGKKLNKEKQKIPILDNLYLSVLNWKINIERLNNYLLKLDFYNQKFSEKFINGCLNQNKNKKAKKNLTFQNYIHVFLLKAISMLIRNVNVPGSVISGKGKIINFLMLIVTSFGGSFQITSIIKNFSTLNIALPAIITTFSFLKGFMAQKIEVQLSNEELKIYSQILIQEIDKQNNFIEETLENLETKFKDQMMAKLTKNQMKSDKALIEITRILEHFVKNKKYEKFDYQTQFSEKKIIVKEESNFIVIDEL